jgi:hypothetical protein
MALQPGGMTRGADNGHDIREGQDGFLRAGPKFPPVFHVLFRPEEMNPASGVRPILGPAVQGNINITTDFRGFMAFYLSITHDYAHGLTAIQAGSVDLNHFAREDPADRQGFKTSLGKPFLLSIHRNAVLRGQVVEGRKGSDQVGFGVEPDGQWQGHQLMQKLPAFLRWQRKFTGDLGEVGGLAPFYKSLQNELVSPV